MRSNIGHWSITHAIFASSVVDRLTHFLHASEEVNKFLIVVLDLVKKHCIYFQKGLSSNLLSADEEYNYNLWCKYKFLTSCNFSVCKKIIYRTMIAFDVRRTQPKLNARSLGRKNLDFRLVQLLEIRHSLHRQGARPSKRIWMCSNVFSFTCSFAHFLSMNESINLIYPR